MTPYTNSTIQPRFCTCAVISITGFNIQKHPRVLSSPTLTTPLRVQKQTPLLEIMEEVREINADTKMQLTFECDESRGINWSNAELKALVEFILLYGTGNRWPTHHRMDYWSSAAGFVKTRSNAKSLRSSNYLIII